MIDLFTSNSMCGVICSAICHSYAKSKEESLCVQYLDNQHPDRLDLFLDAVSYSIEEGMPLKEREIEVFVCAVDISMKTLEKIYHAFREYKFMKIMIFGSFVSLEEYLERDSKIALCVNSLCEDLISSEEMESGRLRNGNEDLAIIISDDGIDKLYQRIRGT